MFRISAFGRTIRPAAMVLLGAVIGAGATPAIAGLHGSAATTTQARSTSCQGRNFHPTDSEVAFIMNGNEMTQSVGTGNVSVPFVCDVSLPNKALVTMVQFTLLVNSLTGTSVSNCGLFRSGLTTATVSTTQTIGVLPAIGSQAGLTRRSTATIAHGTVDTTNWAYWLQCVIPVTDNFAHNNVGIYGADVIYQISAANG